VTDLALETCAVSALDPRLAARLPTLRVLGFTVVEAKPTMIVAVRCKWHWDCFVQVTTVVGLRVRATTAKADLLDGQRGIQALSDRYEPSYLFRGWQHARALVDLVFTDEAEPAAVTYTKQNVSKGFGWSGHTALVVGEQVVPPASPMWGAAFWPKTKHVVDSLLRCETKPEPLAALGLFIAVFSLIPGMIGLGVMCCGIYPIGIIAGCLYTKPLVSALETSP
jgi:hypothetical protein